MTYDVLYENGLFEAFVKCFGWVKIEQTMEQSVHKIFSIWFETDFVEIKEGEQRLVDVSCKKTERGFIFEVKKLY